MEDEHLNESNINLKHEILKKINEKLLNSQEKSVLILLDNFNYLFTNSDYFQASLDVLSELTNLKKKFK